MSTGLYDTKIQGLREQKALAAKLREKAVDEAPTGQMVSGWYVAPSWTQNMANALRQGFAAYDEGKAGQEADKLEKQKEAETNAVMGQLYSNYQAPQAQPEQGFFDKLINGEKQAPQQAPADLQANPNLDQNQRLAAMLRGSMVNPDVFAPMLAMEQHKMTTDAARANHQDTLEERRLTREDNRAYRDEMLAQRQQQHEDSMGFKQAMLDARAANAGGSRHPRNDWEIVKDPTTGMPAGRYNTATGQFEAAQGMPQGALGKVAQGKVNDANDSLELLKQAAPLIDKSTSSAVGAGRDAVAGWFGLSTEGADNAASLKAIGANLVSKVPKMSGPQSDKDVALYKEMAGKLGDPTVPASQKKAAMQTINEINSRYTGQQPAPLNFDTPKTAAPAQAPANQNAKGWALHVDGQGRKAYVNPQTGEYEVVK